MSIHKMQAPRIFVRLVRRWVGWLIVGGVSLGAGEAAAGAKWDQTLMMDGIGFHVTADRNRSVSAITIQPSGLAKDNAPIHVEADGAITHVWVADLNHDGSPEIYIAIAGFGSGSYGSLVAYSTNNRQSISAIALAPLTQDQHHASEYMGHDTFHLDDNKLTRRFPIYKGGDPNCCPSGGKRLLDYGLVPGEATWQLKITASHLLPPQAKK
jgi:hypothetical protein